VLEFDAEAFLTGYIYAPEAKLTSSGSGGAIPIIYNGNSIGNVSVCIIGSALVESIDFPNNRGIAYINPELDGEVQYGKPDLAWEPVQYTRK
ncbi:MAG: hypothetical protein J6A05_03550, partial [Oscillospiraceae bacterium]|nr:hypothetical protein [Oscillospiraceae bacterium]